MTEDCKKSIHKQEYKRVIGQPYPEGQRGKDRNCLLSLMFTEQWILCLTNDQRKGFRNNETQYDVAVLNEYSSIYLDRFTPGFPR